MHDTAGALDHDHDYDRLLRSNIHPPEAIRKTADAYNRTRLTPRLRSLFTRWLA